MAIPVGVQVSGATPGFIPPPSIMPGIHAAVPSPTIAGFVPGVPAPPPEVAAPPP